MITLRPFSSKTVSRIHVLLPGRAASARDDCRLCSTACDSASLLSGGPWCNSTPETLFIFRMHTDCLVDSYPLAPATALHLITVRALDLIALSTFTSFVQRPPVQPDLRLHFDLMERALVFPQSDIAVHSAIPRIHPKLTLDSAELLIPETCIMMICSS